MITTNVDMTGFNRGIAGLIHQVGLNSRVGVLKETGELEKTLVKISPKADPKKIAKDISGKFAAVGTPEREFSEGSGGKHGSGDVNWYAWNDKALYGVARQSDMRDASVDDLKRLLYKITPKGRIRGRRGKQRVLIWKKILTRAATVKKLITAKSKNRGRLAAAWLVSAYRGPIRLTGSNMPPAFVTRHVNGARGSFIDGSSIPKKPTFIISNFAKGVGQRTVQVLVQKAANIRAKAMAANTLLFMKGKKKLSDYAR